MLAKDKVLFAVFAIFAAYVVLLLQGSAITSVPDGNFTVMPDTVYFNWSGTNINLTSNNQSVDIAVSNTTTAIGPVYYISGFYVAGGSDPVYPDLSSEEYANCFTGVTSGMKFIVQNSSGYYTNTTPYLNTTNSTIYTLTAYQYCPPGYYNGSFDVGQSGFFELTNLTAHVAMPISAQNTFNETASKAGFKGMLPSLAGEYHSYYFNTSQAANITGVTLNLTWTDYNKDVDVFLFNSTGSLLGKGIERSGSEAIAYVSLPAASDMWRIKVFGNISSQANYTGWLYFTTLNATNTSNQNQKITSLDFGALDPNATSSQINYTLNNVDTTAWNEVRESKELYRVDTWSSQTQAGYYSLFVPHFAERVKVKLEWTGAARWHLILNDSNKSLIGNSSDKYYNANMSNAVHEEFVTYNGPFSTSNDGFWNITVANMTVPSGNFNLTAYVWLPNSTLVSDYPASYNFSASGSRNVSLYIRVPETNITNGTYEGFTEYYVSSEWKFRLPLRFSVKAGMLTFNNTFESLTATLHDNIGFNRLGANAVRLTLPVSNLGGYNLFYLNTTSGLMLNNTESGKTDRYMTFAVDHWPANPIAAGQGDTLNMTIYINTTLTGEEEGIYVGNITFNTTNASVDASSYPFKLFTLILRLNLTDELTVNVTEASPLVTAQQNASNVTANVTVKLANGSSISVDGVMMLGDFNYSIYLKEGSVSSYIIGLENLTQGDTGGLCPTGRQDCVIKAALIPGKPGGAYYFYAGARFNTSILNSSGGTGKNLTGMGVSGGQVVVNDTGIKLTGKGFSDGEAFYEATTSIYTVEVTNYGPLTAANLQIKFDKGSCAVSVARNTDAAYSNCSYKVAYGPDTAVWNISTFAGYTPACKLAWTLTGNSIDDAESPCYDASVRVITNHPNFGNVTNIFINILGNETTDGGSQQSGQLTCTSNLTCADNQYCKNGACTTLSCPSGSYAKNHVCVKYEGKLNITAYTEKIYVMQGSTNSTSITVKNIGGGTHTVKLEISSSAGLTSSSNPSSYSLNAGNSGIFMVNFSASPNTTIGYYTTSVKAYASDNVSVYDTKTITVAVEPVEETKVKINQTYDEIKSLFASVATTFNQMPPSSDANYTLANRTYYRLLSMLQDLENKIKLGNYMEAQGLLNEANSTLASFKLEISQIGGGGFLFAFDSGNLMTWVAVLVVIIVIGGFLAYLLLPPKKGGFHPSMGYTPHGKIPITQKLKQVFSKIKIPRPKIGGGQKTLVSYERPVTPVQPLPAQPSAAQPEKKTYMEGYHRLDQFPLSYDKDKFKEKKK
jgi:hypothetical protein